MNNTNHSLSACPKSPTSECVRSRARTATLHILKHVLRTQRFIICRPCFELCLAVAAIFLAETARCAVPAIATEPQDIILQYGQQAILSVQASGSALSYQWYCGTQGDVSAPISGATNAIYRTQGMVREADYWVRVANADGGTNSRAARVGLTPHTQLYFTDFEAFDPGVGTWGGMDGWWCLSSAASSIGILNTNQGLGTGKAGFVGNSSTSIDSGSVRRLFPFRPLGNSSRLNYSMDFKVVDSTSRYNNWFDFAFFNSSGERLARLELDNTDRSIWTLDGATWTQHGYYTSDHTFHLWMQIDYQSNIWSLALSGELVYSNAVFTATGGPLDSSEFRVVWLNAGSKPGNAYLVLDNLGIATEGDWGPVFTAGEELENGNVQWELQAAVGQNLAIESSTNLSNWQPFSTLTSAATNLFIDARTNGIRFYRAVQVP